MAYANAEDLCQRYDERILQDICKDDGERETDLSNNDKITTALSSASGILNAACLQGERYTVADLEALTGDSTEFLKTLVCDLAFIALWQRKPYPQYNDQVKATQERSEEWLDRLRNGAWVFNIDAAKEAGRPEVETQTVQAISQQNLFVDTSRGKFLPIRRTNRNR